MMKRMILMLVFVMLLFGSIFGFIEFKSRMIKQFMGSQNNPVQTVSSVKVASMAWQDHLEAVATVRAIQFVDISAQSGGMISDIYFKDGAPVKKGDLLADLYSGDDLAKLDALTETAKLAKLSYQRAQAQFKVQAISEQLLDTEKSNLQIALASVTQQQAIIDKKRIRAPFTGQLGVREIDLGQWVNAGNAIVSLQNLDSVYVDFFLPQQNLSQLKLGQIVHIYSDVYPDQSFDGLLSLIDPKIDPNTRNVHFRATLNNSGHKLLSGMYVRVDIAIGQVKQHIIIPRSAVSFNPYGTTVYVIDVAAERIAKQRIVKVGASQGDQIVVLEGLTVGDEIVTSGQLKLRNGSRVSIDNSVQPSNDPSPQPVDL